MRPVLICALGVAAALGLSGCKIVPDPDPAQLATANQSDDDRMLARAQEIWQPQVLPTVKEHLVQLADLRAALAADAAAAGTAHGLRPQGESNPWNFAVSGQGKIVEAKLDSRAAKLGLDTDADGKADVTVQLGPVIRGTALRDAMPFLTFTDYRDQIEYAKLANALNQLAHQAVTKPGGDVIGQTATFEGVFTLKDPAKVELVPTALTVGG